VEPRQRYIDLVQTSGPKGDLSGREMEGYQDLRDLYYSLRDTMARDWHRCLPLSELLVDRWEKARYLGFGEGTSVYDSSLILGDVRVGKHTWIGPFTILDGSGGLEIGDHCSISAGVQIYTHDSVAWAISGGEKDTETARTQIGSNCYIGPNTVITKGVTIGDGCVIGAMSLVLRSIPAHSKAWGTPARLVGELEPHL
jgi:acetyltransferase-like isoleucine patch superfamily enzyme